MPHCIVEHSDNFEPSILMESVFKGALSSGLFQYKDIKVRAMPYLHFQLGNKRNAFIHVSLKILSGRSAQQKQSLSQGVLEVLLTLGFNSASITVEVIDIDKASYQKITLSSEH